MKKYLLFSIALFFLFSFQAKADPTPFYALQDEKEYYQVKYIELDFVTGGIELSLPIERPCAEFVYAYLREELDKYKNEDENPVKIFGCGSPEGEHASNDQISDTLFIEFYHRITPPAAFKQEVDHSLLAMTTNIYRKSDVSYRRQRYFQLFSMPISEDDEKTKADFEIHFKNMLSRIAKTVYLGRNYSPEVRRVLAEQRLQKAIEDTKKFINKFGNDPSKIQSRYQSQRANYKIGGQEYPKELDNLFTEYFDNQQSDNP